MNPGRSKRLAWSLATVSILVMLVGITLSIRYILDGGDARRLLSHQSLVPISTIIYAILGALVASRHPRNPIGWIFASVALLYGLLAWTTGYSLIGPSFGARLADWLNTWIWIPTIVLPTTFVFLLFPDGRLLSPRWRLVAWSAALGLTAATIGIALHPGPVESQEFMEPNPFGIATLAGLLDGVASVGSALIAAGLIGSVAALVIRFRRSEGVEREQMKWLVYAAGLMVFGLILGSVLWAIWPDDPIVTELGIALTSVVILGIAVAAGIAILRYRLYDINLIINRTLVYGTLSAGVVGLYVLVVGALGTLFQSSGNLLVALLATGLAAFLFQPLRERLQRAVNRLMYGERDDPVTVLTRLGGRLKATIAPDAVLPTLVETVAQTLKLPYVAVELGSGDDCDVTAAYGRPVGELMRLPLVYQAETIGYLVVAPRGPGEFLSPADLKLLENIAHQAGAAVHAVQLTDALQRSRQQLVTAREEERRRIRRNLHDGLGPVLASLALQADTAQALVRADPAEAEALLADITAQAQAATGDVRRLVYDLRPPALDELGLVGALQTQLKQHNGEGLKIELDAPKRLPALPAAVEVAAYRIAQEAITNVIRHAGAGACTVQLIVDDEALYLTVSDDGRGLPAARRAGVGLSSMRERAKELGGRCTIEAAPQRGTCVRARLPL